MAIPPQAIAAAAGAVPEMFKTGLSIAQLIQAKKLAKTPRPEYVIPGAATEAVEIGRNLANVGLPGMGIMQNQIDAGAAGGVRSIMEAGTSGPEKLAAIGAINANQQNAIQQLALQNAQAKVQGLGNLQGQLGQFANWQQQRNQWNVMQPYIDAMNKSAALQQAGQQGLYSAAKGLASAGSIFATSGIGQGSPKSPSGTGASASSGLASGGIAGFGKSNMTDQQIMQEAYKRIFEGGKP